MPNYPELLHARNTMSLQNELYKPTSFWADASQIIVDELQEHGVENFRSIPSTLDYFVPTYGMPGNGFDDNTANDLVALINTKTGGDKKQVQLVKDFISGKINALADYRTLLAADDQSKLPYLHTFSESTVGKPIEQFEFDGRKFSRSALNYLLGLVMLKRHLNNDIPKTVLEIGGGFGTLGEVLLGTGITNVKYIDIDIPPTSFVSQYYLSEVAGKNNVATYQSTHNMPVIDINILPAISVLCSWQIEKLQGEIDLFVNYISFQEMEPHVVQNYLNQVSRLKSKWILLRNMKEGKQIKTADTVGVEIPILSDDYARMLPQYKLVERNVFPFGYRTVDNYNSELLLFKRND
jgi:putative sugar O-methyltransferase